VADFRALPFADGSFDVIVFDPPHLTDQTNTGTTYHARYGTGADDMRGDNVSFLFAPFLEQASRVLRPASGLVLAKIADQIHGGEYQWQARALQNLAEAAGWTCCDLVLSVRWSRGSLIDPRWLHVNHARQVHTYWLALRNGPACISSTAQFADVKPRTAEMFVA
jgi:SAM-dependent methyltransferase